MKNCSYNSWSSGRDSDPVPLKYEAAGVLTTQPWHLVPSNENQKRKKYKHICKEYWTKCKWFKYLEL